MKRRQMRPIVDEDEQERIERDRATEPSARARRFLEAIRAVSPYAVRMLAEGVTGRDCSARGEGITFLMRRYFPRPFEDDPEDPNDREDATLALGISVGLRLRVDASDLGARANLSALTGDLIAATAEKAAATRRRTLRQKPHLWKCNQPRRGL